MKFKIKYSQVSSVDGRTVLKLEHIVEGDTIEKCADEGRAFLRGRIASGNTPFDITSSRIEEDDATTV